MTQTEIAFEKVSGGGNDFVCIDNRDGRFDDLLADTERVGHFARTLCRRGMGVGADGVIFACRNDIVEFADIAARHYEADGSEVELCGNGVGCFAAWVHENRWLPPGELRILTPAGVVRGRNSEGDYFRVCIPLPEDLRHDLAVPTDGKTWNCDFVVVGIPHVVTWVNDLPKVDVARWGSQLRHHAMFQPRGVNANFVEVLGPGQLAMRTFEFGVEGETLACGTGSAACAILTALRENWSDGLTSGEEPILIHCRGGDRLRVFVEIDDSGAIVDLCLETLIRRPYGGTVREELAAEALGRPRELAS